MMERKNSPQLRLVGIVENLFDGETLLHFVEADHLVRGADFGVGELGLLGDGGGEGGLARVVRAVEQHGDERSPVAAGSLLHQQISVFQHASHRRTPIDDAVLRKETKPFKGCIFVRSE